MAQDEWGAGYAPRDATTVIEQEKTRIIIYDANGQPYSRPQNRIGFDPLRWKRDRND